MSNAPTSGPDPDAATVRRTPLPSRAGGDPGGRLAQYEILRVLGQGGFGVVYLARDTALNRLVALKVLTVSDPEEIARFEREAQLAAGLNHPNIAAVYGVGEEAGRRFIAMQYIDGEMLSRLRLEPREAVRAVRDAARAVAFAHARGIVHRDLKPQNLMRDREGRVMVLDFGLAKSLGAASSLSRTGDVFGTPAYMSPEQARGEPATERSDVYGLGATLYELLTGRRAFEGESPLTVLKKVLEHEPAPPRTLDPRLGRDVETIVLKAMDKDPSRRYESASALADDLDRELAGEPIRARRASLGYRLGKRFRRQPAVWTLAGLLLAALAGGAVFGAAQWQRRRELERRELDRTRRREEARPHVDAGRTALARLKALRRRTPIDAEAVRSAETEALDELGRALRIDPDHPEALLESARVHAELERIPQAVDLCARAVAASERFATAYLERALLRLAAYEQLRHDAEGGTREENAESVALRRLIEDDLERVRRWSTDKRELSFAAGMIAFAGGKAREAAPLLRAYAAERVNDDAAWFWSGRAWLYFAEGRSDAVEDLTRAIEANPNGAAAYDSRGIAFNALRRWDRALADFDRAVELNPSYVPAWINRGVAYVGLGDRRAAIGCYDRAIGLDPNHANSYYNRGLSHLALNDLERAVADFTRAAELAPDMEEAFCNRGLAHVRRGDSKSALADFDRAIRIRPDFHTAYANRAVALAETGDVKRAVADLSRALELAPPDWKNREAAQRELGRLKAQLREDF